MSRSTGLRGARHRARLRQDRTSTRSECPSVSKWILISGKVLRAGTNMTSDFVLAGGTNGGPVFKADGSVVGLTLSVRRR